MQPDAQGRQFRVQQPAVGQPGHFGQAAWHAGQLVQPGDQQGVPVHFVGQQPAGGQGGHPGVAAWQADHVVQPGVGEGPGQRGQDCVPLASGVRTQANVLHQ